jgi:hypothetical protein
MKRTISHLDQARLRAWDRIVTEANVPPYKAAVFVAEWFDENGLGGRIKEECRDVAAEHDIPATTDELPSITIKVLIAGKADLESRRPGRSGGRHIAFAQ